MTAVREEARNWGMWPNPATGYIREGAGFTEFLQYEQRLPVSGRLGHMRDAGAAAGNAAQQQADFVRWGLVSELRSAYYALLASQRREEIIEAGLRQLDEVIRVLKLRESEGEGSAYDRLRAERERAELEGGLAGARSQTIESRSRVETLLDASRNDEIRAQGRLDSDALLPPIEELFGRAIEMRGDLGAQRELAKRFAAERRAAERLRVPEPTLIAGLKRADVGRRTEAAPFLVLTVPLPVFNRGQADIARFRAEAERSHARGDAIEQQIRSEVKAAHANLTLRRQTVSEYRRRAYDQGLRLQQIARTAYEEGEAGILELLDAYRITIQAGLRELELLSASKQAEIELERTVGQPVLNREVMP
ncbi:MAG: TolC family protein [Bryobacteraceae bacterium]